MQCQRCQGQRYVMATEDPIPNKYSLFEKVVCPDCHGYGDMPCCDGEDRWQPDKMDRWPSTTTK